MVTRQGRVPASRKKGVHRDFHALSHQITAVEMDVADLRPVSPLDGLCEEVEGPILERYAGEAEGVEPRVGRQPLSPERRASHPPC